MKNFEQVYLLSFVYRAEGPFFRLCLRERRPAHFLSADDVQVDVEHGLTRIGLAVEHKAGAAFFETEVLRDKLCAVEHLAHEFAIFRLHVHDGCDVALRHDQKVYRCLRGDVIEGEHVVVFVDFLGRDFTLDDFAEKTIFTHSVIIVVKVLGVCVVYIQLGNRFLI